METLSDLLNILELEKIKENSFVGQNYITPWRIIFGGQVLGQSLHAAYATVPEDRFVHSLHGYFILPGNVDIPVEYEVDITRDGGSFTTRRVQARQKNKTIFVAAISFQVRQEGLEHQIYMPNVVSPEILMTDLEQLQDIKDSHPMLYQRLSRLHPNPIEFRPVEQVFTREMKKLAPFRHVWMKSKELLEADSRVHHQVLAFASDYNLLGTALLPHRETLSDQNYFIASLDHAMWFHRDFDINEWLLFAMDSPSASNSRALTRGNIFSREGKLVVSLAQEGLIRIFRNEA
ncbi:MAG: acyl-CoA thioesterase [Saprospiraceae bacterium]|jgi:acyl-CoA thioesterase-2